MQIKRSDVVKVALGTLVGGTLTVVMGAGPDGAADVAPRIMQISSNESTVYRLWSDGHIEANHIADLFGNPQQWKGWKTLK